MARMMYALDLIQADVMDGYDMTVAALGNEGQDVLDAATTTSYWLDPDERVRFERSVGEDGAELGATGVTLITNVVCSRADPDTARPYSGQAPEDFEQEVLWMFTLDLEDGYDIARIPFQRTATGLVLSSIEVLVSEAVLDDECPGFVLMQALLGPPTRSN